MNITVFTICYNEQELINSFLEHYYMLGANRIVIYDNNSTDNTLDICNDFKDDYKDCAIEIIKYDTNNQIRDDIYLEIKNNAWKKYNSDYYIIVDCDEFLEVRNGDFFDQGRLIRYLKDKPSGLILPKVLGVQVVTDSFEELYDISSENLNRYVMDPSYNKRCIFGKEFQPTYKMGCHNFTYNQDKADILNNSFEVESSYDPLYLFHLKYIDREYVIDRYNLFKSRLSDFNKLNNYGSQYEMNADQINSVFNFLKRRAITVNEVFSNV